MAALGGAGGDGVDTGGDGDKLRLLGLLVGAQGVPGCLAGGAQLPGHRLRPGQGAGLVVGPRPHPPPPPRRPPPLRRLRPRRIRPPVRPHPRLPPPPLPARTYTLRLLSLSLFFSFLYYRSPIRFVLIKLDYSISFLVTSTYKVSFHHDYIQEI